MVKEIRRNVTSFYGDFGNLGTYDNRNFYRDEHGRRRKLDVEKELEISDGVIYR